LVLPTILWAGNAIIGRLLVGIVSPMMLNTFRWALAALILLPWAYQILRPKSPLWSQLPRFLWLGLLGVGSYNALLYLSLETSTPINVTLIGSSMPIWMLLVGSLFYKRHPQALELIGAVLSLLGVVIVLTRGELHHLLDITFVSGDLWILLATILWAFYSWMLSHPGQSNERDWFWAQFLFAQMAKGLLWSVAFTAIEWQQGFTEVHFTTASLWALLYIALGPSLIAYRCWGMGVQAAGPAISAFFANLIPLFTAIFSTLLLGEWPQIFHAIAFSLIVAGIFLSSRLGTQQSQR